MRTVYSCTYGDLLTLARADFDQVMQQYPASMSALHTREVVRVRFSATTLRLTERRSTLHWAHLRTLLRAAATMRRMGIKVHIHQVFGAAGWINKAIQQV